MTTCVDYWCCPVCGFETNHTDVFSNHIATHFATKIYSTANDKQIAGDHYKKNPIQPWDYVAANNLGYFEGTAVKYLTRWKDKGGVDDLRKAIHFIEKLIEIETQ